MRSFLFACALFATTTLSGQILEINLGIENIICPICPESLTHLLCKIDGVENCTVIDGESLVLIAWKSDRPFTALTFHQALQGTQFIINAVDITLDGKIEEKKGALTIVSKPDNSIFYIDNREDRICDGIKNGDKICAKCRLFSQQGSNYLVIKEILPPIAEQEEET